MMQARQAATLPPSFWLSAMLFASPLGGMSAARADDALTPSALAVSGFGSVGMAHSNERQADYTSNVLKGSGVGYSHPWSADVDSRLGAQVDWRINSQWSAVVQIISEQNRLNSSAPAVEWLNLKYQFNPDFSVRLGRVAVPALLAADYRKVGYALPWVRTPVEVYGNFGVSSSDGVDLSYRWRAGPVKNVTQAFYGSTLIKISETSNVPVRQLFVLTDTADYGAFTLRASYLSAYLSIDLLKPLFDAFRQYGAAGSAVANEFEYHAKRSQTFSAGLSYDPGKWFAMTEIAHVHTDTFVGVKTSMYASLGYRMENWTPFLTYSAIHANDGTNTSGLSLNGLSGPAQAGALALNGALNELLASTPQQKTVSAGLRWDVVRNIALKVQYDRVMPQSGSPGTLVNVQPGFRSGAAISILSAVVDFVY